MRKIRLDLRHIHTVKALHIYLAYMLNFPAYYGRNLDALYDLLTQESEPTSLEILRCTDTGCEAVDYFQKLCRVLEDAAQENPRLHVTIVE